MKNKHKALLAGGLLVGLCAIIFAASGTIHTWTGKGSRRNTVEFEIREPTVGTAADFIPGTDNANSLGTSSAAWDDIQTYDLTVLDDLIVTDDVTLTDQIIRGDSTAAASTTTSNGSYFTALLVGSTDCVEGSLLVGANATLGTSQGVSVTISDNVADLTSWIGVAVAAASTGSVVNVYNSGWVLARTTGTVTEGQTLVSSADAEGHLAADITPTTGADVGVALEDGTAAGGLTLIRLR